MTKNFQKGMAPAQNKKSIQDLLPQDDSFCSHFVLCTSFSNLNMELLILLFPCYIYKSCRIFSST